MKFKIDDNEINEDIFELFKGVFGDLQLRYSLNAETKGNSWLEMDVGDLSYKLVEELADFCEVHGDLFPNATAVYRELEDIILVALMIASHLRIELLKGYEVVPDCH